MTDRSYYNGKLLGMLEGLVKKYPDMRFNQILETFDFVSGNKDFYIEPDETAIKVGLAIKVVGERKYSK